MKERREYMFTLVRQWGESGLTRKEFCLQHGITMGKFSYWISRWKEDQSGGDNKLPYKFSYVLVDNRGRKSTMMIEDWEIGQLYWNCLSKYNGDEAKAVADVRKKYFDDFAKSKDLHLYLGTSQAHHYPSRNPFMIIGTFH